MEKNKVLLETDKEPVELLAVALVREYLSRKGFKHTLSVFDKESEMKEKSIQNRRVLAEKLFILDLVKKNKNNGNLYRCFLEMIIGNIKENEAQSSSYDLRLKPDHETPSTEALKRQTITCDTNKPQRKTHSSEEVHRAGKQSKIPKLKQTSSLPKTCVGEFTDVNANSICSKSKMNDGKGLFTKINIDSTQNSKRNIGDIQRQGEIESLNVDQTSLSTNSSTLLTSAEQLRSTTMIIDDLSFNGIDSSHPNINSQFITQNCASSSTVQSKAITLELAVQLKELVLGSAMLCFNEEWKMQGFTFNHNPLLQFGLVQEKGGTCGLLAAVQAVIIKIWLFREQGNVNQGGIEANVGRIRHTLSRDMSDLQFSCIILQYRRDVFQPSKLEQSKLLVSALSQILVMVKKEKSFIIALPTPSIKPLTTSPKLFKSDTITEKLQLFYLDNQDNVVLFLRKNLQHFQKAKGCILFLFSVVLTCGVQNIKNSMDEPNTTLIGRHGYCTQEMVNLLLTGDAISNVFDGDIALDQKILHGLKTRSEIGFLSLFEHYQSCQVGNYYKNPVYPIWVVCSESHFSVLFSSIDITKDRKIFDLYYYDGLARQDEEIKLSVSITDLLQRKPILLTSLDLIPPLEHCIRTKWKDAEVSWNSTEPIL